VVPVVVVVLVMARLWILVVVRILFCGRVAMLGEVDIRHLFKDW
jgi:hypothetical protein